MNKAPPSSTTETKLAKLRQLNAWQWMVLLLTPFVLLLIRVRLRYRGYQKTLLKTQAGAQSKLPVSHQLLLARETAYALAVSVKYAPWNPLCLSRSLALAWFLGRKGLPFEVLIGVPGGESSLKVTTETDFSAHAWVEHAGCVLNDKENVRSHFRVFEAGQALQDSPGSNKERPA